MGRELEAVSGASTARAALQTRNAAPTGRRSVCKCEESSAAFPKNAKPPQREPGGRISYRCRDSEGFDPKATETWGFLAMAAPRAPPSFGCVKPMLALSSIH